jgi:hypothetical protein
MRGAARCGVMTIMAVISPASVSRYYFVIRWPGGEHDDVEGTPFRSDADALAYAHRIIGELKEAGGYDDPRLTMTVLDAARKTVLSVPFALWQQPR